MPVQSHLQQSYRVIENEHCPLTLYWFDNDEALLHSGSDGLLYPLDAFGLYAWFAIEAGMDKSVLIGELVERGADAATAPVFVQQLSELFHGRYEAVFDEPALASAWNVVPMREASDHGADYCVLDIGFTIACDNEDLRQQLDVLLQPVISTQAHPLDLCLRIENNDDRFRMIANDYCVADGLATENLLPLILDGVRRFAYLHSDFSLALHAAALSDSERTLLMPALSGSGKSTLTAALMARGWCVHSDEIAALDTDAYRVRPLPLGVGIKSSGWSLLAGYFPSLLDATINERLNGIRMRYLPIPSERAATASREVTHLVFPCFNEEKTDIRLKPLSVVETIRRINRSDYHIAAPLDDAGMQRFLAWLCALPRYAMDYAELDDALVALESLH